VATFISNSPDETEAFGRRFAENLKPGDVLALTGGLGSGKTQFVKGLTAGLGAATAATSPTFTLIHEYSGGDLPVYHFDFFRLEDRQRSRREPRDVDGKAREGLRAGTRANQSAERLGLDDYFFGDGVSVIEWADRFPDLIPETARWISFETKSETQRAITTK
jgi:tRNA threonylcarbamoyladenosine biosynthesis protein TsaE